MNQLSPDLMTHTELKHEVRELRRKMEQIADIAEGSSTLNSLPHIAKIARGENNALD